MVTLMLWCPAALACAAILKDAGDAGGSERAEALYNDAFGAPTDRRIEALTEAVRLCPGDVRFRVALGDAHGDPYQPDPQQGVAEPVEPAIPAGLMRELLQDWRPTNVPPPKMPDPGAFRLRPHDTGDLREQLAAMDREMEELRPKPLNLERARALYEEAAEAVPGSPLPHLRLAEMDRETHPTTAEAHLQRAAELDPGNAYARYELALLRFLAGDDEAGRRQLALARACQGICHPVLVPTRALSAMKGVYVVNNWAVVFYPVFARYRELARQVVRVAGEMRSAGDADAAAALVGDGELLARRVMASHPRQVMCLILGAAIDRMIASALLPADGTDASSLGEDRRRMEALQARLRELPKALMALTLPRAAAPEKPAAPWEDEAHLVEKVLRECGLD